jgi:hypothetical protein
MDPEQVKIYVDYKSKTNQARKGNWFMLPKATKNKNLNPFSLFAKYKQMLEQKSKTITKGWLWVRIDQNKDGSTKIMSQVWDKEWISEVPKSSGLAMLTRSKQVHQAYFSKDMHTMVGRCGSDQNTNATSLWMEEFCNGSEILTKFS